MYKSKLQELCQRRSWELPEYSTVKDGPDHVPRFTAAVNVHGQLFETPAQCKSAKEAQNTAARIAFDHFNAPSSPPQEPSPHPEYTSAPAVGKSQSLGVSPDAPPPTVPPAVPLPEVQPVAAVPAFPLSPLPSSLPTPPRDDIYPGLLATKNASTIPANSKVLQQNCKGNLHMYKNQLQHFAQKKNFGLPMYTTEAEGPPHACRFKSSVSLDGKSYETPEFYPTLKDAEQAAAKVACQVLSVNVIQEDGCLYKNLLQELAQRRALVCPSYETVKSGLHHRPSFTSTVELGGHTFRGAEAKTKKQAEMNAAKAAYYALMESGPATEHSSVSSISEYGVADGSSQSIQSTAPIKNRHDASVEEDNLQAKRAKPSPENMNVNTHIPGASPENMNVDTHLPGASQGSSLSDDLTSHPQPDEEQLFLRSKTVVYPRKSNMPKPESSSVLPFSDDQWIAYKVKQEQEQEPTA